ncbi:hypothetical protein [Vulcanisaeta sp. JCM 16161]|uniref:hypothetical protein n=1 Tax=Vulcanisaeta sp. JCM 16161 TaxID=1295372 RepID=UPI0006CFD8BB|nr:hypothetical protein [Vulcanisaeta sp. JCM 16161]
MVVGLKMKWFVVAVLAIVVVFVFALTMHFVGESMIKSVNQVGKVSLNAVNGVVPVSINVPIYVIGPQTLIQSLINVGVNESLIKPTTINQLPNLPNNSIMVIDWSAIRPLLYLINRTGVNAASPAINTLVNLLKRGDLVLISVNKSSLSIAELVLAYSLARADGVEVSGFTSVGSFPYPISQYLIAYPVMPITTNYTLIAGFVYRRDGVTALIVGPLNMHDMPGLVITWLMVTGRYGIATTPLSTLDPGYENTDPCYATWLSLLNAPSGSEGVYENDEYIFIWGAQALASEATQTVIINHNLGIAAVKDNYGDTFYYDSCILILNTTQFYTDTPPNIPIELIGDVAYVMTPSGGNSWIANRIVVLGPGLLSNLIGGFDLYASYEDYVNGLTNSFIITTSSGYSPTPQSSSGSLFFGFSIGYESASIFVEYTLPSIGGASEGISVSTYPSASAYGLDANNYTWNFYYSFGPLDLSSDADFINGLIVGGPGMVGELAMPNFSLGNTYWVYAPFNAEVETTCWDAWANMGWEIGVIPASSSVIVSPSNVGFWFSTPQTNAPSGSWVNGVSYNYSPYYNCPNMITLSAPS